MPSGGYETPISATKRPQTCALDRRATGIGRTEQLHRHIQISNIVECTKEGYYNT
jgi:hypothetical protein